MLAFNSWIALVSCNALGAVFYIGSRDMIIIVVRYQKSLDMIMINYNKRLEQFSHQLLDLKVTVARAYCNSILVIESATSHSFYASDLLNKLV